MKGVNQLQLNEPTMIEAVQEYFTKRATAAYPASKVLGIKYLIGGTYEITVEGVTMTDAPVPTEVMA